MKPVKAWAIVAALSDGVHVAVRSEWKKKEAEYHRKVFGFGARANVVRVEVRELAPAPRKAKR